MLQGSVFGLELCLLYTTELFSIVENKLGYEARDISTVRRKVNVLEMKCLRRLVGVSNMDRVRNEEVLRRAGIERELVSRADQRVSRWFGHVERMDEYQWPEGC